jgi:CRP-like cAMP-binding protein/truncated hemoglobin YjbI
LTNSSLSRRISFIDSFYWTISTTTSTGYGDIALSDPSSRIFAIAAMISGGLLISVVTALITSFLTSRDALSEEQDRSKKMLNSMLDYYRIPEALRREVVTLFPLALKKQAEEEFRKVIQGLPPQLEGQLEYFVRAHMFLGLAMFSEVNDVELLLPLVERLQRRLLDPGTVVIEAGTPSTEIFFLVLGTVHVVRQGRRRMPESDDGMGRRMSEELEDEIVSVLRAETVFGDLGVVLGESRKGSVVTVTPCELLVLEKSDLDEVLQRIPALNRAVSDSEKKIRNELGNRFASFRKPRRKSMPSLRMSQRRHGPDPPILLASSPTQFFVEVENVPPINTEAFTGADEELHEQHNGRRVSNPLAELSLRSGQDEVEP